MNVTFTKTCLKQLSHLKNANSQIYWRVMKKINALLDWSLSWEKLKGKEEMFKIRVWNYRLLYSKNWVLSIEIITVEKRGRVYRRVN